VKVPYKIYPAASDDPGYGGASSTWMPILNVSLVLGNHAKTHRFEALVDSGAFTTYFHSDLAANYGIDVKKNGVAGKLKGVVDSPPADVYYHPVKLCVGEHLIKVTAGFYDKLTFAGILGRHGFFEHFQVLFDPANKPAGFETTRIYRV
jgi:hypothetical protein